MKPRLGPLLPILLSILLFGVAVFAFILPRTEEALIAKKRDLLKEVTTIVWNVLSSYEKQTQLGQVSRSEAQTRARERIRQLRYGQEGKDYFWLVDDRAWTIMHPYFPNLEGRDTSNLRDADGKPFLSDFVRTVVENGQGYAEYSWPWQNNPLRTSPKLSYAKMFHPWNWIIGTGAYLDDVNAEMQQMRRQFTLLGGLVFAAVMLLYGYVSWHEYRIIQRQRQAEQAAWDTLEKYRAVLEASPNPMVVYDKVGQAAYINPAFSRVFGWSPEEVIDRKIDYVPPEDQAETAQAIGAVYTNREGRITFESRRYTRSGEILEVSISAAVFRDKTGVPVGMVVSLTDISTVKRSGEKLRESEEMFRALSENSPDGIMRFDQNGRHLYVNPALEKQAGIPSRQLVGHTHRDLGFPEELARLWEQTIQSVFELKKPNRIEFQFPPGVWIDWLLFPEFDDQGQVKAVITSSRDISERKKAEEERRSLEAHLRQAQKLEAIGTLAGGIAHDFNNILGAITGNTELALLNLPKDLPVRSNLKRILSACERAKNLTRQILTFSRVTEADQKPVQVKLIIKEVLKLLRASLPATIDIQARLTSDGYVLGDPTEIHQMLMNLCTNSAQAMADNGGTLGVSVEESWVDASHEPDGHPLKPGLYLAVTVSDTGPGIDEAVKDRIFDPFFTTKAAHEGTGLGLAVVHGIVTKMGGTITLSSRPGQGAVFQILLTAIHDQAAAVETPNTEVPPGKGEHILLVDDEAALVDTGARLLEGLGYRVTGTTAPLEALEIFTTDPAGFDLVITDQTMPTMTGEVLVGHLMKVRPDIPVIVCTGYSRSLTKEAAERLGIKALAFKPLARKDLAQLVRNVLDQPTFGL